MATRHSPPKPHDVRYIYRASKRCRYTGEILYAKNYGFKAWRIPVTDGHTSESD